MVRRNGDGGGEEAVARRVVLLGGKALAIHCLESMLRMPDVAVVAVIPCADEDPAAERWYPSLAGYSRERGLPVYQPKSVNEDGFLSVLQQLRPHVVLSVFYDKILKPQVLRVPTIAAVNVHFGLLPHNQGSFPIPWAMIDGNDPGVTIHHMDPGVDTGDIIAQMAVPASDYETAREIYDRCTAAGLDLFERYLPLLLGGQAPRRRQPAKGGTYYRPGDPFHRWIDWSQSTETVCRFVRALTFPPFPSARTAFRGRELEVCHPVRPSQEGGRWREGTVLSISPPWITVATGDGLLNVRTMRLEGEERAAADVLRQAGCSERDVLDTVPWVKSETA